MTDVTQILLQIEDVDPQFPEQLLVLVYNELRWLGAQTHAREKPGQTLEATGWFMKPTCDCLAAAARKKASNNTGTIGNTSLPLRPLVLAGAYGASICV